MTQQGGGALLAAEDAARELGARLTADPVPVAFVAASYDTAFESRVEQVETKLIELTAAFGRDGPLRWSLWLVDDLPAIEGFAADVRQAFARQPELLEQDRLRLLELPGGQRRPGGERKGYAVREGVRAALAEQAPAAVVYLNLNLKVPAVFSAPGLLALEQGWDAAVGSRDPRDGGQAVGAGRLGRLKTRGYAAIVRAVLPELGPYRDVNAPMKVLGRAAAELVASEAGLDGVCFDLEWLWLLHRARLTVTRYPIVWTQRPGSSPPWHLALPSALDAVRLRTRSSA